MPLQIVFLILLVSFASVAAIACYDNMGAESTTSVSVCDECKHCEYILHRRPDGKNEVRVGVVEGNDDETNNLYAKHFRRSTSKSPFIEYKVLSVCIYEKIRANFEPLVVERGKDDLMLRCMCNTDLCNVDKTFDNYLAHLDTASSDF